MRTTETAASIAIEIGVLSLPAGLAAGRAEVAAAFERELSRLVEGDAGVRAAVQPTASLACGCELAPHMSGHEVGVAIARAVFEGMHR